MDNMMEKNAVRTVPQKDKLGIALVGLGTYSTEELAPALKETKYCELKGIVTGSPEKIPYWKQKYGINDNNILHYDNFEEIASKEEIDIVYIVLPNSQHANFTVRAAKAGKHVICEKPMAISVPEGEEMIAACTKNGVKLGIGYRLHFDPYHQYIMKLGRGELGRLESLNGEHSMELKDPTAWRLQKKFAGGGPLMDVGIYVVQAACYSVGQSPIAVREASFGEVTHPDIFQTVEQSIQWRLEFPDGLMAWGTCSYSKDANYFSGKAVSGSWQLEPAFAYKGLKGKVNGAKVEFPEVNQQSLQMDEFAKSILDQKQTIVPGEMGLRDLKILMAIYEAAETGKSVPLHL
jgi:predicted dehydrogenase